MSEELEIPKLNLWNGLDFWKSGEWQVVDEALQHLDRQKISWNPGRACLFRAMELTPLEEVKVCFLGQDPYPDSAFATGLAFDVGSSPVYPPSMRTILKELKEDLDIPHTGNLEGWAKQGVFLWNCIPSCETGSSLSHHWVEWCTLTEEILVTLGTRNIVFVPVGNFAKHFRHYINETENEILYVGHPSPRNRSNPFLGSRIFSRINTALSELGHAPVDWRL